MNPSMAAVPQWDGEPAGRLRASIMGLLRIDRWDVGLDGPLNERALQQKLQSLGYEAASRVYPAGAMVAAQSDSRERIQAVARGLIKVTIDGESAILTAGDMIFVPRGAVRRVEVIGRAEAHCLEAVYSDDSPGNRI
jgi:quercetin dioxygenase-like cupin family protein